MFVIFEHSRDSRTDLDCLPWITKEVPDHADIAGVRQLDKNDKVRSLVFQSGMNWVPSALPAEYLPLAFNFNPIHLEGEALVTKPFRTPLEGFALCAAL